MDAVYNKALLSGYLIVLKLREAVESGVVPTSSTTPAIEFPEQTRHLRQKLKQEEPPKSLQNDVKNDGEISVEVDNPPDSEWMISIKKNLRQASQDDAAISRAKMCIYRVPYYLREGDDKAYVPQIVSVGPYHHGKKGLQEMDCHKWRALHHVLKRSSHDINLYLDAVKELEKKARACYQGLSITSLSSNKFVEMMVLDGCFVIELFRGAAEGLKKLGYSLNDPIFAMRGSMHSIQRDMIMLENQLPLFILDRLLGLQLGRPDQRGLVAKLALQFFDPLMPTYEPLTKSYRSNLDLSLGHVIAFNPLSDRDLHCLDVFRRSLLQRGSQQEMKRWFLPCPCIDKTGERAWISCSEKKGIPTDNRDADERRQQLIHCVTELKEAGIKFKKKKTDRFWDIEFKDGILYIPRILIHDGTKSLLLNLIAFEQCHLDCRHDITAYVVFMDNLINSHQDVGHLHYRGIIKHWLGSDSDVADLFNHLCQDKTFEINDSYLSHLAEDVNQYYDNKCNACCASLRHNYFNTPWAFISFLAAGFLLLLTFAQTFYGIYGYYKPR